MQIKNTTFIQRHIEKIVIGSAGFFFLVVAAYYLLNIPAKPFGVALGSGKQARPINISEAPGIMQEKADELGKKLRRNTSPVDPVDYRPPNYTALFAGLHQLPTTSGRPLLLAGDFPLFKGVIDNTIVDVQPYDVPSPPVPRDTKVFAGNVVLASGEDRPYISIEAAFDAGAWADRLADAAKSPANGHAPLNPPMIKRAQAIAGVYAEREQWNPRTKAWGDRKRIVLPGQAGYLPDQAGFDVNADAERAGALQKSILDNQPAIQRTPFPALDPSSPKPLLQEAPKPVGDTAGSFGQLPLGPSPAVEKAERPQPQRLWVHDLTVEAGQKYRYRLVACVLNPLYNITKDNLSPEQTKENATRVSLSPEAAQLNKAPWMEKAIPATSHCFLVESSSVKNAKFEVWKVIGGSWVKASFDVKVGDVVGSKQHELQSEDGSIRTVNLDTQRTVVDIFDTLPDADSGDRGKVRAVALMDPDGRLEVHYLNQDAEGAVRRQLLGATGAAEAPAGKSGR